MEGERVLFLSLSERPPLKKKLDSINLLISLFSIAPSFPHPPIHPPSLPVLRRATLRLLLSSTHWQSESDTVPSESPAPESRRSPAGLAPRQAQQPISLGQAHSPDRTCRGRGRGTIDRYSDDDTQGSDLSSLTIPPAAAPRRRGCTLPHGRSGRHGRRGRCRTWRAERGGGGGPPPPRLRRAPPGSVPPSSVRADGA